MGKISGYSLFAVEKFLMTKRAKTKEQACVLASAAWDALSQQERQNYDNQAASTRAAAQTATALAQNGKIF